MLAILVFMMFIRGFPDDQFAINDFFYYLGVLAVRDLFKQKFGGRFPDFFRELVDRTNRGIHVTGTLRVGETYHGNFFGYIESFFFNGLDCPDRQVIREAEYGIRSLTERK